MIRDVPAAFVSDLFSPNFMRCLMNQLMSSERLLHEAAEKSVKALLARARIDTTSGVTILHSLLAGPNGRLDFDKYTKSQTIEALLSSLPLSSYNDVLTLFDEQMLHSGHQAEKQDSAQRLAAADHLVQAVRRVQTDGFNGDPADDEMSWIHDVLKLLGKFAYVNPESSSSTNPSLQVSQSLRQSMRDRVSSCLLHLFTKPVYASYFAHYFVNWVNDAPSLLDFDARVQGVMSQAQVILDKLSLKSESQTIESPKGSRCLSMTLLYSLSMLQVYNDDPEAVAILDDLNRSQDKTTDGESADLVEILLSFASKPSQLFRRLCQQVFFSYISDIGEHGLQSMVKV